MGKRKPAAPSSTAGHTICTPSSSLPLWGATAKRSLLVGASVLALVAASDVVVPPRPAYAVICDNAGAGGTPAGVDGGTATNTACGVRANDSGTTGQNRAYGNNANASGNNSLNTATGSSANANLGSANVATGQAATATGAGSNNVATGRAPARVRLDE